MSQRHSMQRARSYSGRRAPGEKIHWGGLIISAAVLAIFVGLFYVLTAAGLPFMGDAATLIFMFGYAFGVYAYSVRPKSVRYDYASAFGILVGFLFVILNIFNITSFGSILYSLATSNTVFAVGVSVGLGFLGLIYLLTGFISAKETKV